MTDTMTQEPTREELLRELGKVQSKLEKARRRRDADAIAYASTPDGAAETFRRYELARDDRERKELKTTYLSGLAMAGEEKVELWLIDRALRKIDETLPLPFGLCEYSKQGIQRSRLELIPWTPLSIEGAQYMEESGLTLEDMLIDD